MVFLNKSSFTWDQEAAAITANQEAETGVSHAKGLPEQLGDTVSQKQKEPGVLLSVRMLVYHEGSLAFNLQYEKHSNK